jgi:hypothetical protein
MDSAIFRKPSEMSCTLPAEFCMLEDISFVTVDCSSTAAEIVEEISWMLPMVVLIA